ncbi:hypothetical protein IFM89_019316 [Coptis chinensis]|uniref:Mitochondrial carrier protein n=1 Tax=Coptis chinensis TaxID=261450 RepID=A0A835ICX1_9MAGN|nr:hypothetical protein IFM89_019316 [Coptis chinensis]
MVCSRTSSVPSWMGAAASRVDFDPNFSSSERQQHFNSNVSDFQLSFGERALSAAGSAFLSAILVNPLEVVKTRLQAQAAVAPHTPFWHHFCDRMASLGPHTMFSDLRCSPSCARAGVLGTMAVCPPDCFQYKGTVDVFHKIIRQEGFARLWRGTNASLALAIPTVGIYLPCYDIFRNWIEEFTNRRASYLTPYAPLVAGAVARSLACISCYPVELAKTRMQAFKEIQVGVKPPGVGKTLLGILSSVRSTSNIQTLQSYRVLWTGVGAQLARDVPFSAICWSTLEPIRRRTLGLVGEEANAASILGANFSHGFVAGSLAAAATCPLDVAKTRRQIEKDPVRALLNDYDPNIAGGVESFSESKFFVVQSYVFQICIIKILKYKERGMMGLFTGVGPRVARAGPSVGIVVSSYEVVKYILHRRQISS